MEIIMNTKYFFNKFKIVLNKQSLGFEIIKGQFSTWYDLGYLTIKIRNKRK